MVRKFNEKVKQTLGNYEILTHDNMSESQEYFVEMVNRIGALAYDLNDMTRFMNNAMEKHEQEISDADWKKLANRLHRLEYLLNDAISTYSDIYQDLDVR